MNPKSYVSFSLWGTQQKYLIGAILNAALVKKFFLEWQAIFYTDGQVPKDVKTSLEEQGALIVDCRNETKVLPCMWRFLAHDIPDCARFISRDCDSRISSRDRQLVDMWEASGKNVHFIQDHIGHKDTLLAGAWGSKTNFFGASMRSLMEKYSAGNNVYGVDQNFLKHVLWPKARTSVLMSTDLAEKSVYVGQVFDENNEPVRWTYPNWENWK